MKSFKQFCLYESDTSDATNAEIAICYQYNLKRTGDTEKALSDTGVSYDKFKKLTPDLMDIGKKVADQMGDRGPLLIHSGSSSASKNYYEGGNDTTPKADFFGNSKNYISLKKSGSGGTGAQLMSAKSAEAAGVVRAAVGHYEKNSRNSITDNKDFLNAIYILETEMKKTARNDLNIEVAKGKKSFEEWYVTSSSRKTDLSKKERNVKKVESHLKSELSLVGATRATRNADKNLIDGVQPINQQQIKLYYDEYVNTSEYKVGDVTVSAKYLKNVSPDKLEQSSLKQQITEVIETSINSKKWQDELSKFFNNNEDLKKWMVYEAGSGLYKFTGKYSNGSNYFGPDQNVANKILVFYEGGIKREYDMMKYAESNTSLVNNVSVSYKGSGRSKYIKLGIASSVEYELPTLQEEWKQLESQYYLSEGLFGDIKNKLSTFLNAAKNLIRRFYENVIKRVIDNLKILAQKGIISFLDSVGLDTNMRMKVPSW